MQSEFGIKVNNYYKLNKVIIQTLKKIVNTEYTKLITHAIYDSQPLANVNIY